MDGAETGADGSRGRDRKSESPPCVCEERRHKNGAPSGIEMSERVGQPPTHPITIARSLARKLVRK